MNEKDARGSRAVQPPVGTGPAAMASRGLGVIVLLFSGSDGQRRDYVAVADWLFIAATGATLLAARARKSYEAARTDRTTTGYGHRFTTVLILVAAGYVIVGSVVSNPGNAIEGAALLAVGWPACAWWRRTATVRPA